MLIATYEEKNVHNIEELQRTYNVMLKYRVSVATRVLGRLIRGQMLAAMNVWKIRTAKHRNFLRMNMHLVNRNTTKLKLKLMRRWKEFNANKIREKVIVQRCILRSQRNLKDRVIRRWTKYVTERQEAIEQSFKASKFWQTVIQTSKC